MPLCIRLPRFARNTCWRHAQIVSVQTSQQWTWPNADCYPQRAYSTTLTELQEDDGGYSGGEKTLRPQPHDNGREQKGSVRIRGISGSWETPAKKNVRRLAYATSRDHILHKPSRTISGPRNALERGARRVVIRATRSRAEEMACNVDLRPTATYRSMWNKVFARISRRYSEDRMHTPQQHSPEQDTLPNDLDKQVGDVLSNGDGVAKGLATVAERQQISEQQLWARVVLWLLRYDQETVCRFLLATNNHPFPPINWVEDSLQFLAHWNEQEAGRTQEAKAALWLQLINTTLTLLDRRSNEQFVFFGSLIRQMLPYCTPSDVDRLFQHLKMGRILVHWHTTLHLVHRFAHDGNIERALDALLVCRQSKRADVDSVAFRSTCTALLRQARHRPDGLRVCLRLVEGLAHIGVRINSHIYHTIMLNAVEAGDLETVRKLYQSMRDQGIKPDKYTCAIRLKACKTSIDDAGLLSEVIEDAITHSSLRTDEVVVGEVLHCLALHHVKNNRGAAFDTVLAAFAQFYHVGPLLQLGLPLPNPPSQFQSDDKPNPTSFAIKHLLWVWLETKATALDALEVYKCWRELVRNGDPVLARLAEDQAVANMFLKSQTHSKKTLLQAAQIMKDMQLPLPESSGVKQSPPDIYSWSIFLHGFAARGQAKLADQVLRYMRQRGMEPNDVTWGSLIHAYAKAQDADGLSDAIRRADASGMIWNRWTHGSVSRFKDKSKLRKILEQHEYEKRLNFTNELKESIEQRMTQTDGVIDGDILQTAQKMLFDLGRPAFADSAADLAHLSENRS